MIGQELMHIAVQRSDTVSLCPSCERENKSRYNKPISGEENGE